MCEDGAIFGKVASFMSCRDFYEKYWSKPNPPPEGDPTTEERKRLLLRALNRKDDFPMPKRILDAGCGAGEFLEFFASLGWEVYGIDVADAAIERARSRCPAATLCTGSLEEKLPFPSQFFDVIWCTEVVEHLFEVPKALAELSRVLKEHGLFILTTPHHGLLKNLAITFLRFERHFDVSGPHIRFFTRRSLTACVAWAGFETLSWRGIGRLWPLYKSSFVVARKVRDPGPLSQIMG